MYIWCIYIIIWQWYSDNGNGDSNSENSENDYHYTIYIYVCVCMYINIFWVWLLSDRIGSLIFVYHQSFMKIIWTHTHTFTFNPDQVANSQGVELVSCWLLQVRHEESLWHHRRLQGLCSGWSMGCLAAEIWINELWPLNGGKQGILSCSPV